METTLTSPVIGKNVIESLTEGMYEDSRFIFREYIQNSADAIDKAIVEGLLKYGDGEIHITIDPHLKTITFYDNGTGIPSSKVAEILGDIASSTKEIGKDKGFRGIGRLGGLGYCEKLTFETSFKGEAVKSLFSWNASELKKSIDNRAVKESASEVMAKVTTHSTTNEDLGKHYFKVILEGVKNETLLDKDIVKDYLRMVAPIPYPNHFLFRRKIKGYAQELQVVNIDEYKVYLGKDLLEKAYSTIIYEGDIDAKKKIDEIFDIEVFYDTNKDGEILYWGWYGVSKYEKVIAKCNLSRGIRLRKANIQIGADQTLVPFHKESRGNFYFIGEIHAVHSKLIPNSRRDNFIENETYEMFFASLSKKFRELYKLYYDASKARNADKDIKAYDEHHKKLKEKIEKGFTNNEDKEKAYRELESRKKKAEEAEKILSNMSSRAEEGSPISRILGQVISQTETRPIQDIEIEEDKKPKFFTDKYTWLDKSQRKLLSRVFGTIENVLPKELAQNLIAKIDEELKR